MNLAQIKASLKEKILNESEEYFGFTDPRRIEEVTSNWFNDAENYDGRWKFIYNRTPVAGRVLDMAAGCGTFVLNGLRNGYDVYGVEPEKWKIEYLREKILASGYPDQWNDRVLYAVGEDLPFEDEYFQLVTSYQTLEHVLDVNKCIQEMLRVLKPGGVLYIRAPDYNCFFEPHYRIPFLPKMNKNLAAKYLKLMGKPVKGLYTLQWITEKDVINYINAGKHRTYIQRSNQFRSEDRKTKILEILPTVLKKDYISIFLNKVWEIKLLIRSMAMIGREEKNIDLWIKKLN